MLQVGASSRERLPGEVMNKFFNLVLSFKTFMWIAEVMFFFMVAVALLFGGEAMPWWGALGLIGAVVLLSLLVWANSRSWQENQRRGDGD